MPPTSRFPSPPFEWNPSCARFLAGLETVLIRTTLVVHRAQRPLLPVTSLQDHLVLVAALRDRLVLVAALQPLASDDEGSGEDEHDVTELGEPDADGLIPKPDGEVGRKKRGYSFPTILGWDDRTYWRLKKKVNVDISNYLDHTLSAPKQPAGSVLNLTKVIAAKHPIVSKFRDGWPIADLIHLRLKYTSGRRGSQRVPQGPEYPKDLAAAVRALERGKAVERHPEPEAARGTGTARVGAQAESGQSNGPSPILMGVRRASKRVAERQEVREREDSSDSGDEE
ncbi:hypothetical protein GSI_11512 [Ganoderma sinense ZZ0214-1]|uniref:Uncharacterized protein n=1 Tax=Ganoderma sinense ZZ0214-1 TaxID=1077348 RepID=A0A2G8RW75_9APHY|nr:hypothetical protein GSI_14195 [Ganoderma sinense ZZ0214-1]PIL25762.1 hypothetical protein GSI_11512 [Ganoderma sinense ZZ0214-1]